MAIKEFIHVSKSSLAFVSSVGKGLVSATPLSSLFLLFCSVLKCECVHNLVFNHKQSAAEGLSLMLNFVLKLVSSLFSW